MFTKFVDNLTETAKIALINIRICVSKTPISQKKIRHPPGEYKDFIQEKTIFMAKNLYPEPHKYKGFLPKKTHFQNGHLTQI